MQQLAPSPSLREIPSYGLIGPFGMQNFSLTEFLVVYRSLVEYKDAFHKQTPESAIGKLSPESLRALDFIRSKLYDLKLTKPHGHLIKVTSKVKDPATLCAVIFVHLDEALTDINYQIATEWTYHYGTETSNIADYESRWHVVLKAFPSAKEEIEDALDCFALKHYTASIFHFMRVGEHGLRLLAKELEVELPRGKPLSHANWQEIMTHCDKKKQGIAQTVSPGDKKDKALEFYSVASAQLHAMKDAYRNEVMHSKSRFGIDDAVEASRLTKRFMEILASRMGEKSKKGFKNGKIEWGF